jgi:mono/diheme cytochrome c family protein
LFSRRPASAGATTEFQPMSLRMRHPTLALIAALLSPALAGLSAARADDEPVPKFDAAYMANPANIKIGEEVWQGQCRHCHGNAAYPGKAPKLNAGVMDADFIFDRVTNGFRKMPPWKEVFTLEQRKGVVAYIKSTSFSP